MDENLKKKATQSSEQRCPHAHQATVLIYEILQHPSNQPDISPTDHQRRDN